MLHQIQEVMKRLINTLIVITSLVFVASLILIALPNEVEIDGHKYNRIYDERGECELVHVEDCGCWTRLNDEPK